MSDATEPNIVDQDTARDPKRINPGDIVNLKSGGPKMTVAHVDRNAMTADCRWFVEYDEVEAHSFTFFEWELAKSQPKPKVKPRRNPRRAKG